MLLLREWLMETVTLGTDGRPHPHPHKTLKIREELSSIHQDSTICRWEQWSYPPSCFRDSKQRLITKDLMHCLQWFLHYHLPISPWILCLNTTPSNINHNTPILPQPLPQLLPSPWILKLRYQTTLTKQINQNPRNPFLTLAFNVLPMQMKSLVGCSFSSLERPKYSLLTFVLPTWVFLITFCVEIMFWRDEILFVFFFFFFVRILYIYIWKSCLFMIQFLTCFNFFLFF